MARPRKDQEGPNARERMIEAFWSFLEEGSYSEITVRGLCSRASVNPNTFYAYFGSMDDLAESAFQESVVPDFPAKVTQIILGGADPEKVAALASDARVARGLERMLLLARSGSPSLESLVLDTVRSAWLASAGRRLKTLTREERADLAAVVGAQMALLSSTDPAFGLIDLAKLSTRPLGMAIVTTVAALREG